MRRQVDLSYLLKRLSDDHSVSFRIDRTQRCTPRRNVQVQELLHFFEALLAWAQRLGHYLQELQGSAVLKRAPGARTAGKLQGQWPVEPLLVVALPLFCEQRPLEEERDALARLPEQPNGLALCAEDSVREHISNTCVLVHSNHI